MTDTQAIQFYSETVQYVENFGLSNLDREDRIMFKKGKKLVESALTLKVNNRVPLTEDEILPIFQEYLNSYDENGQVKVFDRKVASVGVNPTRSDVVATAMGIHGQIVFYDRYNDTIVKSFDRTGKTLKSILKSYNEETGTDRFAV